LVIPRPEEGGLRRGKNFWLRPTTASAQCLRLSERFIVFVFLLAETADSSSVFPPNVMIIVVGLMILLAVAMILITISALVRRRAAGEIFYT